MKDTGLGGILDAIGREALAAARALAHVSSASKNAALAAAAAAVRNRSSLIMAANQADMAAARGRGLGPALLDRLRLDAGRIEAVAVGLEQVVALPDPVGRVLAEWTRPNGLVIQRVSVPLGVIGIIYESRPNVTADAGACA